jgi:hypothetical protein
VAENSEDHRGAPAQFHQHRTEDEHRRDFGDLTDAHDHHAQIAGNAHAIRQEAVGENEVAVVDDGVDEGDDEEHEHEWRAQQFRRATPCQFVEPFGILARRRVWQRHTERGHHERNGGANEEDVLHISGGRLGAQQENEGP